MPNWTFRLPTPVDAQVVWRLVTNCPVLDDNSLYAYLLICRDFCDTSLVAERSGRVAGFVAGYRTPGDPEVLFVWQIGVAPEARRCGLARKMLQALAARVSAARPVPARFIEATITAANRPSWRLFESFAEELGVPLQTMDGFGAELFGDSGHDGERRLRIGPLPIPSSHKSTYAEV